MAAQVSWRRAGVLGVVAVLGWAAVMATVAVIDRQPASAVAIQTHVATRVGARPPILGRSHITASPMPTSLWVDPATPAATIRANLAAAGRSADAAQLAKISGRPTATWLTGSAESSVAKVKRVVAAAATARQLPVFVLYHLPDRDCGGYSSGGASSAADYRAWVSSIATAIGGNYAEVIVEPDAVAMAASRTCPTAPVQSELVAGAVRSIAALAHTTVYLDGGHSAWVSNVTALAASLRAAGLADADGFALNVSNFQTLSASLAYGDKVSAATGGKHYVVDTSRDGVGPLPKGSGYVGPSWCNPPGRALGVPPTLRTGHGLADAYLWIKYPGASDGSCGLGDPPAGTFWPDYALGLAQRSA